MSDSREKTKNEKLMSEEVGWLWGGGGIIMYVVNVVPTACIPVDFLCFLCFLCFFFFWFFFEGAAECFVLWRFLCVF